MGAGINAMQNARLKSLSQSMMARDECMGLKKHHLDATKSCSCTSVPQFTSRRRSFHQPLDSLAPYLCPIEVPLRLDFSDAFFFCHGFFLVHEVVWWCPPLGPDHIVHTDMNLFTPAGGPVKRDY
jgi:hypothetical protein